MNQILDGKRNDRNRTPAKPFTCEEFHASKSSDLGGLANIIKANHQAVERLSLELGKQAKQIINWAVCCGEALIQAKEKAEHGQWQAWLKNSVGIDVAWLLQAPRSQLADCLQ